MRKMWIGFTLTCSLFFALGISAVAASLECGTTNGCLGKSTGPTSSITIYNASCKVWSYTSGTNTMGKCVVSK